jgi:hypothetical protein
MHRLCWRRNAENLPSKSRKPLATSSAATVYEWLLQARPSGCQSTNAATLSIGRRVNARCEGRASQWLRMGQRPKIRVLTQLSVVTFTALRGTSERSKRGRNAMHRLSISQIISTHPRERLFTHPLIWTERQISLLSCEFFDDGTIAVPPSVPGSPREQLADTEASRPLAPDSAPDPDDELRRYLAVLNSDTHTACFFAKCKNSDSKQRALSRLLGGLDLFRQGSKSALSLFL